MNMKSFWWASTALTGALLCASVAAAQSTGTAELEEVTVTAARGPSSIEGLAVAVDAPKSRVVLEQEYIATQIPGQSVLDTLNILPSVQFTNNDPFGSAGGDINIRGFDSQRISLLFDGVPLNDSGNYEIYPNQQLDPELIERVTVNLGTTDVDSPTAAAAGGWRSWRSRSATSRRSPSRPARRAGSSTAACGGCSASW